MEVFINMDIKPINLAQYLLIEKEIQEMRYGLVQLTLRVDDSFICDVVIHKAKRSLFKRTKDGTIEAREEKIDFSQEKK